MPMVLITNDPMGTWYDGMKGRAFPISHIKDFHYFIPDELAPGGGVFGSCVIHFPDGQLLYTEAEYNEVVQQKNKAIDDLAKHAQTIVDMQKEKLRLQNEVDQAMRYKAEVPLNVANAIKSFRTDGRDNDYILKYLTRDHSNGPGRPSNRLVTLRNYSNENGGNLIQALVNGYTVEQSPEERLQEKIEELIQEWYCTPSVEDLAKGVKPLASRIVEQAKQLT